jgi:pimeloyl-ACP methyl ester carboxylesterase
VSDPGLFDQLGEELARIRPGEDRGEVVDRLRAALRQDEPTTEQAFALSTALAGTLGDHADGELGRDLALLAHRGGHPGGGLLVAQWVDRLLVKEPRPQRYGTLRYRQDGETALPPLDGSASEEDRSELGLPPWDEVLSVYLPPGHDPRRRYPVLYASDGRVSAPLIELLIRDRRIPPIISIGVPFGNDIDGDRRAQEYLWGRHPERFEAHRRYFAEEVPAWAEDEFGATDSRAGCAVFGVSNGASFAATMGVEHPDRFGAVIAFSLGWPTPAPVWSAGETPRYYLCAGTLEEGFLQGTERFADRACSAGAEVVHHTRVSGHDVAMWDAELPGALEWAFGATPTGT